MTNSERIKETTPRYCGGAGAVRVVDPLTKNRLLALTEALLDQGSNSVDVSWCDFSDPRVLV